VKDGREFGENAKSDLPASAQMRNAFDSPFGRSDVQKRKKASSSSEGWLRVHKCPNGHTAATDVGNNLLLGRKIVFNGMFNGKASVTECVSVTLNISGNT